MKKYIVFILIICTLFISGCNKDNPIDNKEIDNNQNESKESEIIVNDIKVIINNETYTLKLDNNDTAKEFINLLPKEYTMTELNGNEKYVYMDKSLITNSSNPKHIYKGDVYLYGDNCLVIFYKDFDTSYSYTKIGHIDNLGDLGSSNIIVKFEK